MPRFLVASAVVLTALAVGACGSSGSPTGNTNSFAGTWISAWSGEPTVVDTLVATESGTTIQGTDVEHAGGTAGSFTVNGSQTGTSVTFTFTQGGTYAATYKGTFVSALVVDGYIYYDASDSVEVHWTKE